MRVVARTADASLREVLPEAARQLGAELHLLEADSDLAEAGELATTVDVVVVDAAAADLQEVRTRTRARGIALLAVCRTEAEVARALDSGVEEWVEPPVEPTKVAARLRAAARRFQQALKPAEVQKVAERVQHEELLYDRFTGFPTLPLMLERGREMLDRTGRLTILYVAFNRYSKLEEIYGWQRLDEVLQTTANAVREFYDEQRGREESVLMVSHTGDDDFIFFTDLDGTPAGNEQRINEIAGALEARIREWLESEHGEDVAGLFDIYIGATTLFRNPKIRTERLIYRGIREAAQAARSVESRERTRKVADLRETLREGAVYVEYHPIVVTDDRRVYGYEALARGTLKGLRSPEVMFGVAEEANLIWDLSRLCRQRAVEGIGKLEPHQLLFLNIDPHDFRDPSFRNLEPDSINTDFPDRIVLEITERTAITDYPLFQGYLKEFRDRGFRFAVDDAGSGYAGLGSIANLEPDYIKLDISLISGIDTNFMKQTLVETMVQFANDHGIRVIAEGVEREEEYDTVRGLGVHLSQGFLFHRPRYVGKE